MEVRNLGEMMKGFVIMGMKYFLLNANSLEY